MRTSTRTTRWVVLLASVAMLFLAAAGAEEVHAQVVLRLNHSLGVGGYPDQAAYRFKELVEQRSGGKVQVRIYSAGELGEELEQYDLMQVGALESALMGAQWIGSLAPEYGVLEMPYLWKNQEHYRQVWDSDAGEEIRQTLLQRQGIRIIAVMNRGARNLTTTDRPVRSPDDLRGLKIRTTENPVHTAAWAMLGAQPTPMTFGEVFTALQQRVIDGQENPYDIIKAGSLHEVQNYLMQTEHVRSLVWWGVSDIWFRRLDEATQNLIVEAAREAGQYNDQLLADGEADLLAFLSQHMTIIPASEIDLEAFQARLRPMAARFAGEWKPGLYERIVNWEM